MVGSTTTRQWGWTMAAPRLALLVGTLLCTDAAAAHARAPSEHDKLSKIFADDWEWRLADSPTWATSLGDLRWNDRWSDESLEAYQRRHAHRQSVLAELDRVVRAKL